MNLFLAILAGWVVLSVLVTWCVIRFAAAQEREDEEEFTRWNREAAHVQHDAAPAKPVHGLN